MLRHLKRNWGKYAIGSTVLVLGGAVVYLWTHRVTGVVSVGTPTLSGGDE
jgi:hypothetical protein